MRGISRGVLCLIIALLASSPVLAWKKTKGTAYPAVGECPSPESLCLLVSCPAKGDPSLELMLYEHAGYWQCMDTYRDWESLEHQWRSGRAPWKVWP